jgi:hypothetical protein
MSLKFQILAVAVGSAVLAGLSGLGTVRTIDAGEAAGVRGGCYVSTTPNCPGNNTIACTDPQYACTLQQSQYVCPAAGLNQVTNNGTYLSVGSASGGQKTWAWAGWKYCTTKTPCLSSCSGGSSGPFYCDTGAPYGSDKTDQKAPSGAQCTGT